MNRMAGRLLFSLFFAAIILNVSALDRPLPTAGGADGGDGSPDVKVLDFPGDLRAFRERALKADGFFTPDIAFTIHTCPKCRKPYVFGTYPRLSRAPFDSLQAVQQSIEESIRKPAPKTMYSPRAQKQIPRACPYCGEPERDAAPNKAYFCHFLPETGDDLHIEYTIHDRTPAERIFWRIPQEGAAVKIRLTDESETSFRAAFGCHFSLRARWNEIFAAHWDDDKVLYENAAPGVWLIFRPAKVTDAAFQDFAEKHLVPDRDKGLFTRLESVLKIEGDVKIGTYLQWAKPYADKFAHGTAECFVGISLPELRTAAVAAVSSRRATLNFVPPKPAGAGEGFLERGPLKIAVSLRPMPKLAALSGLSLQQTCSFYLGEGSYSLDAAERLGKSIQAVLPQCSFDFEDGRYMIARDREQQQRKMDLLLLAGKLDPDDPVSFGLYRDYFLRFDPKRSLFGTPPLEREISPAGMPAFIERRIRPADHMVKRNQPGGIVEPFFDSDGKRCDLCYTSECNATVVYVDTAKPRFKDIPDVNAARRLYNAEGGTLPLYIESQDALRFPGGIPGLLECRTAILFGADASSMAGQAERASALADFGDVPDDTKRIHFYAFTTNCAALAPRKLMPEEFELVNSRVKDFLKTVNADAGLELNLHFDLPRTQPKGKVLRRKK